MDRTRSPIAIDWQRIDGIMSEVERRINRTLVFAQEYQELIIIPGLWVAYKDQEPWINSVSLQELKQYIMLRGAERIWIQFETSVNKPVDLTRHTKLRGYDFV